MSVSYIDNRGTIFAREVKKKINIGFVDRTEQT